MNKLNFIFLVSIFYLLNFTSKAQEPIWAKAVSSFGNVFGVDADIDSQGNIFITGYGSDSTMNIDNITYNSNGAGDAFIAKLSHNRQLLWFRTLGGNDNVYSDESIDIHVDVNDDVIILLKSTGSNFTYNGDTLSDINSPGQYSGEGVIIKIDNNGNYLWHDDGSVSSSFQAVTTDSTGNVYLTGYFSSSITLDDTLQLTNNTNGTTSDMFVAKYTSAGVLIWAKNVGGTVHNTFVYGHNIEIDESSDKLIIIGRFNKSANFDTGVLSTIATYATFLVAYSTNGTELWNRSLFNNNHSFCQGLDISSNSLIGVAGFNSLGTSPDGLVGFYDLSGNVQSEEIYSSPNFCRLYSLEFNHLNECLITGVFRDTLSIGLAPNSFTIIANTNNSGLILKLDDNQMPIWASQRPTRFKNKVTSKNNLILYSCLVDEPFIYNFGADTIINNSGDAIFAEILDCSVVLIADSQTACGSYFWPINNTLYSASGIYIDTLSNAVGCDSIVSLNLTIDTVEISISVSDSTITANANGALYQWLDCNNNNAVISGATAQSFTANANGVYAVEITQNSCTDTSQCVTISTIGIAENNVLNQISIFPNPTTGIINVNFGDFNNVNVRISSTIGQIVFEKENINESDFRVELNVVPGIYLIEIFSHHMKQNYRILIE